MLKCASIDDMNTCVKLSCLTMLSKTKGGQAFPPNQPTPDRSRTEDAALAEPRLTCIKHNRQLRNAHTRLPQCLLVIIKSINMHIA